MNKEIIVPQFTWDEFEQLVLANLQDQYSRGEIELKDLLYAPKFDRTNPEEWFKWVGPFFLSPQYCIIWDDVNPFFWIVCSDNISLCKNSK